MIISTDQAHKILIVSDDLTGACDAASPFCEHGFRVKVLVDPVKSFQTRDLIEADVISINTNSRRYGPEKAAKFVSECLWKFDLNDFRYIVKKIDSTLRGSLVSEVRAVMDTFAIKEAYVAPAFPDQSRVVRDGQVFVDGISLDKTEYANDAISPASKSNLNQMFQLEQYQQSTIRVFDSETNEDLDTVVEEYLHNVNTCLLVGSSGVTRRLALGLSKRTHIDRLGDICQSILYVVGSRSQRSLDQVEAIKELYPDSIYLASNGLADAALTSNKDVSVILVTQDPQLIERPGIVAARLAKTVMKQICQVDPDVIVLTGGDTALACLREIDASILEICGDFVPGLPVLRLNLNGKDRMLVTKAGGFGERGLFVDILEEMKGHGGLLGRHDHAQ
ncbi:MAG: four-carbon acid sugar kinase family protein [Burkholderiales bacterium]|nr:four-carbon acid sugar kinase family protein [Burkholderiales bacterium]OUT77529.1 MAG: hypothetical protein CBB82_05110 [Betaproteobacteria bacterium TMED22]|tara:strand:+ start:47865 stop:49040 length:1176 start_codon:yes stop_codon:yes gene_type:complete